MKKNIKNNIKFLKRPIIFWWITPSIHMEPCMNAFGEIWPGSKQIVWCKPLSVERKRLGWREPKIENIPQHRLTLKDHEVQHEIKRIVDSNHGAINIYSGWKGYPRCYAAYKTARKDRDAKHIVVAEAFKGWGIRKYTRHLRAFLQTLAYRKRLDAILAIGEAATHFYRQLGFSYKYIYPFIYQSSFIDGVFTNKASSITQMVYVGKFDHRKGLSDLLRALSKTEQKKWELTIFGDGLEKFHLESIGEKLGIEKYLNWKGIIEHEVLIKELFNYDIAIVPSRFDGWGVFTNEALQAGLAVVVSDKAASKDLVKYSNAGIIFKAADYHSLAAALNKLLNEKNQVARMKEAALNYRKAISGVEVAKYLKNVIEFINDPLEINRPRAPWVS